MTANQLQNAANQINQQVADEQARHNAAVEEETQRNNTVIAGINEYNAETQRRKQEADAWYQQKSLEIDEQYKNQYLALQKAQGDEANRIKAQMADTDQLKAYYDAEYKRVMEDVAFREQDLKQRIADETELHNRNLEDIEKTQNVLTRRQQDIMEKYNTGMLAYYGGVLANNQVKVQNEYQLGLWNTQLGIYNVQLGLMNQKLKEKQFTIDIANTIFNGAAKLGGLVTGAAAFAR